MPNNLGLAGSLKKSKKHFIQTSPPPPPPLSSPLLSLPPPLIEISVELVVKFSSNWHPRWDIGLRTEVKRKRLCKSQTFIEKPPFWSPQPSGVGGGPHVGIKFVKKDCIGIIYGNVSYKYAGIIIWARLFIFFTSFLCVKKLALSFLRFNESNFRICVV